MTFDCIVIGGGPGGYVAAIRAAQLGLKTALVEEKHLGGVCLNWGCIPTKSLLKSGEILDKIKHASIFGVNAESVTFDLSTMVQKSRDVSAKLAGGIAHLMKKNKVTVIDGRGKLSGPNTVKVGDQTFTAKNIVLAVGARPKNLPHVTRDGDRIWNAADAMTPKVLPTRLLVIGSGAIGIEFASFYNSLGVEVVVVEVQPRILPQEDSEIAALAQKAFEKKGIHFMTNSTVSTVKSESEGLHVEIQTPKALQAERFSHCILAVGIEGNVEDLGLETTKVKVERNFIDVQDYCQTHEKGIYAIGDVASPPWLAHKASHEGMMVAEHMKGLKAHSFKKADVPGCTYSSPQIASIGLSEDKAKALGLKVKVGRFSGAGNGKALTMGDEGAFYKVLFDEATGAFLGAHLLGSDVSEMIHSFALALRCEATEEEFFQTIFPHPTLSEMIHEAALNAYGRAIHM